MKQKKLRYAGFAEAMRAAEELGGVRYDNILVYGHPIEGKHESKGNEKFVVLPIDSQKWAVLILDNAITIYTGRKE